jgi:predicted transcriptional regulator
VTDKEYIKYLHQALHDFCGMKVHLVLEDNYIDPKVDLDDAMDFISTLLKDTEYHLLGKIQ